MPISFAVPARARTTRLGLASVPMRRAMAASATQNRAVKTRPVTPSSGFVSQRRRASALCSPGMLARTSNAWRITTTKSTR